jgi:hypothetical protein
MPTPPTPPADPADATPPAPAPVAPVVGMRHHEEAVGQWREDRDTGRWR